MCKNGLRIGIAQPLLPIWQFYVVACHKSWIVWVFVELWVASRRNILPVRPPVLPLSFNYTKLFDQSICHFVRAFAGVIIENFDAITGIKITLKLNRFDIVIGTTKKRKQWT